MAVFYSKVYKKGLKILNRVFVFFSEYTYKIHHWMMKSSEDTEILDFCSKALFAVSGLIITAIIFPNVLDVISSVNKLGDEQKTAIIGIVIIIISVFYFIGKKIARKLIGKEILFPARYKLLVSIASVPIVIIIHKFLTIGLIKKNGQNNTNN